MRQVINRATYNCGFGGATQYLGVGTGQGSWTGGTLANAGWPWPIPGTFQNFSPHLPVAQAFDVTYTIYKNGVATAITVTIPAGQTDGSDTTHSAAFAKGDLLAMQYSGSSGGGFAMTYAIHHDSTNVKESGYGLEHGNTLPMYGGALGNGFWQTYGGSPDSNTFSIAAADGDITALYLHSVAEDLDPGESWDGYLRKQGTNQDGSGGTVDTHVQMTLATKAAHADFTLPITAGQHFDTLYQITGSIGFSTGVLAAGIAFTATTDGDFQICGGSNAVRADTSDPFYFWCESEQNRSTEATVMVPVGVSGLVIKGLYVELGSIPNGAHPTASATITLRKNGVDTAVTVVLTSSKTGFIVLTQAFAAGDFINLALTQANSPDIGAIHWGLIGSVGGTLVISKVTVPSPDPGATSFDFVAGGGLSPASFSLANGDSRTYSGIAAGTYSIVESPPANVQVSYAVSNDSPNTAIAVAAGESVAVVVTDTIPVACPTGLPPTAVSGSTGCASALG